MNIIKTAAGVSACFAAGLLLAYLNVPMALMFGPIILIIIAHRFNVSLTIPKGTLTFVQMVLGTSVGLMFTRVDLSQFDHLLLIMLIMVSCLAVQFTVSFLWFRKRVGWSVQESLLGAVRGNGGNSGADGSHRYTAAEGSDFSYYPPDYSDYAGGCGGRQ